MCIIYICFSFVCIETLSLKGSCLLEDSLLDVIKQILNLKLIYDQWQTARNTRNTWHGDLLKPLLCGAFTLRS